MQIGAMNHPARDPLEELAWMAEMELDYIDLTIEPPAAAAERIDVAGFQKALERHEMGIVGHTAFYAPIASGVERLRQAAVQELVAALQVFAKLGTQWVNIHPDGHTHFLARGNNVERNLRSLRELVDSARRLGTNVMIENVPGVYNNADQLAELLDPFDPEELGLLLDIGHTNLRVPSGTNTSGEILHRLGKRVRHVHLHDNYGGEADLHLPLGVGHLPFREALQTLKATGYDGTITLEVFAPDKRYFAMSRDALREAWAGV